MKWWITFTAGFEVKNKRFLNSYAKNILYLINEYEFLEIRRVDYCKFVMINKN